MSVKNINAELISNILSVEDYQKLKSIPYSLINKNIIEKKDKYEGFKLFQSGMYHLDLPELDQDRTIYDNLIKKLSKHLNLNLIGAFGFFARYSGESPITPNLAPHFDTAGKGLPTLTISIQLSGNIKWPLYINDTEFILNDNDALVFCGTNNIHWRPYYEFLSSDYLDIFVCHFFFDPKDEDYLPNDHFDNMMEQQRMYDRKYEKLIRIDTEKNDEKRDMPYENFKPTIIKNIFTQDQIDRIYKARFDDAINQKMQNGEPYVFADTSCGYITSVYPLPEDVQQTIIKEMQERSFFLINNVESHLPRYTLQSGSNPRLHAHYDSGLKHASLTLSIQLKSTLDWDVCVENDCYSLKENEALMFSGTHQLHWRPDISFSKEDYYDIIVCQVHDNYNEIILTDEHRTKMSKRGSEFNNKKYP